MQCKLNNFLQENGLASGSTNGNLYANEYIAPESLRSLVGDGVTDNHATLQAAINAGGHIILPSGTFLISDTLNIATSSIILEGNGFNTIIKLANNTNKNVIYVGGADRVTLRDFYIDGNKANNTIGAGVAIYQSYACRLERLFIHNAPQDGVNGDGTVGIKASLITIDTCIIESSGRNSVRNEANSQDLLVTNTFTQDAESFGLYLNGCFGASFTDTHFYRNGNHNVYIVGGGRHRFTSCTLDRSQGWGVYLTGNNIDTIIEKSIIFDNDQAGTGQGGIILHQCTTALITGCTIYDEQTPATQDYGVFSPAGVQGNIIINNVVKNSTVAQYSIADLSNNVVIDPSTGAGIYKFLGDQISTSTATGCLTCAGGVGIAKELYVGDNVHFLGTDESTSPTSGILQTSGGIGCSKNLYVGGNVNISGSLSAPNLTGNLDLNGIFKVISTTANQFKLEYDASNSVNFDVSNNGSLIISPSGNQITLSKTVSIQQGLAVSGDISCNNLIVDGMDIGLSGDTNLIQLATNVVTINGSLTTDSTITSNNGNLTIINGTGYFGGNCTVQGDLRVESGDIGSSGDPDLIGIANNQVTIRGDLDCTGHYEVDGIQVITNRISGWTTPSGTASRSGYNTATATHAQLAETLKALIDDLTTHGLIGS